MFFIGFLKELMGFYCIFIVFIATLLDFNGIQWDFSVFE